jgi:hypothetical protein
MANQPPVLFSTLTVGSRICDAPGGSLAPVNALYPLARFSLLRTGVFMLSKIILAPAATDDAFAAFWSGHNDRALALLHNVDAAGCAVMRARVWLRLERFERTVAEYERRPLLAYGPAEATGLACCAAVATASLGDGDRAHRALEAARRSAERSDDPLLALQCAYVSILVDLVGGEFERSRAAIGALSALAAGHAFVDARTTYQWELGHIRARIFQHEGRHHELESDRLESERCFTAALAAAESTRNRDRLFEAQLLALLSGIVAETPSPQSRADMLSRASATAWTAHLDASGSLVRSALANNHRLFGLGGTLATPQPRHAGSLSSRLGDRVDALLLEQWPSTGAFYEESRYAVSLALDVDWGSSAEHEVTHLLRLAVVVAPHDVVVARRIADLYANRVAELSMNCATMRGPGREPLEMFTEACLAKAERNHEDALVRLSEVSHLWTRRGLGWAASLARLERYSLTGDDADLEAARTFAATYPASSFARRLLRAIDAATEGRAEFPYLGLYRRSEVGR